MHTQASHNPSLASRGAGFTIIELIVSIAVIALLVGLVSWAIVGTRRAAQGVTASAAVSNVAQGMSEFERTVGFIPPLVKDQVVNNAAQWVQSVAGRNIANVYRGSVPADETFLRTLSTNPAATNPFDNEERFSEVSLAYFLVGALDVPYGGGGPATVPMDGVIGPGLYKPDRDGGFEVPKDVRASTDAKRVGTVFEPFVNLSKGGVKLSAPEAGQATNIKLVDSNDQPLRYYRWLNGVESPAGSGTYVVNGLGDLRVPRLVGRLTPDPTNQVPQYQVDFPTSPDRDLRLNAELRSANWAIVAAGPNKLFGDEPLADLARGLGKSGDASNEVRLRAEAEADNIVKVGRGRE
jgi:prepilin-type N-terminal cleavage/methylation domain-containing protein